MTAWLKLALAILQVILWFIRKSERQQWINEGERRAYARELKELTNAIATAAAIRKEYDALSDEALDKRIEEKGWYRD